MRTVIAFDPSYNDTGYAVVRQQKLIAYGVIKVEGPPDSYRFASLMHQVEELIQQYAPSRGIVEKPPPFPYRRSTKKLPSFSPDPFAKEEGKPLNLADILKNNAATTVIITTLGRYNVAVEEVLAHLWKKCYGKNFGKTEMVSLARSVYPVLKNVKLSHHEAEAICMAALYF